MAEPKEPLTERELEVVRLVATGASNKEIGAQLFVSPNTVRVHLRNIFTKLEAQSRTEVTMMAVRNGWVDAGRAEPAAESVAATDATAHTNGSVPSTTSLTQVPETAELTRNITDQRPVVVPVVSLVAPVPVAPNAQPNAPLPVWRKVALVVAALLLVAGSILVLPRPMSETSALGDASLQDTAGGSFVEPSPAETTRWYARASVRTARARSAVAVAKGQIYVIGGDVERQPSAEVLLYDPRRDAWTDVGRKTTPIMNTGAAVIKNMIYVPGGTTPDERASNVFEAFDVLSKTWSSLSTMPRKLAGHAVTSFGDTVYVLGGQSTIGVSGEVFAFDTRSGRWSSLPSLPTPRSQLAAVVSGGRIYAVGGFDGQRELTTCEYFQISEGKWHTCAPMTIPRGGLGLAAVGPALFAVGGSGFIGFNERYDVTKDKWVSFEIPPSRLGGWRNVGVASLPTEFYVIGGSTRGTTMADMFVYEVMNNRTFLPAFGSGQGK